MLKKHSIFYRYISHMRRSSKHIQQVHAITFSGAVTVFLAVGILYFDYGFWHDRYISSTVVQEKENIAAKSESPVKVFSNFIEEAKGRLDTIKLDRGTLLEGKKSYSNKEEFLAATTTASPSVVTPEINQ
jgi:hypothetical protein